jgi:hypothetical protein
MRTVKSIVVLFALGASPARAITFGNGAVKPSSSGVPQLWVDNQVVAPDIAALSSWAADDPVVGWMPAVEAPLGAWVKLTWDATSPAAGHSGARFLSIVQTPYSGAIATPSPATPDPPPPSLPVNADQANWTRNVYVTPGQSYTFQVFVKTAPAQEVIDYCTKYNGGSNPLVGCGRGARLRVSWYKGTQPLEPRIVVSDQKAIADAPAPSDLAHQWIMPSGWTPFVIGPVTAPADATFAVVRLETAFFHGQASFDDLTVVDGNNRTVASDDFEDPEGEIYRRGGQFRDQGVHLYRLQSRLADAWRIDGTFDFTLVDNMLNELLNRDPNARVILDAALDPPLWWTLAQVSYQQEADFTEYEDSTKALSPTARFSYSASFASDLWNPAKSNPPTYVNIATALNALVNHVSCAPVAGDVTYDTLGFPPNTTLPPYSAAAPRCMGAAVFGYWLDAGVTGEWQYYPDSQQSSDYSGPMLKQLHTCLQRYYPDDPTFQKAWGTTSTRATAQFPARADATGSTTTIDNKVYAGTLFLDPATNRSTIDFHRCINETVRDTLLGLAQEVKGLTKNSVVVGAYNGYLLEEAKLIFDEPNGTLLGYYHWLQESGHRMFEDLLDSPYVDLFGAPVAYSIRALQTSGAGPAGTGGFIAAVDSVVAHGKLWIQEDDTRTSASKPTINAGAFTGIDEDPTVTNAAQTVAVLDRNFGLGAAKAVGQWWYDMLGGWYDDTTTLAAVQNERAVAQTLLSADRSSVSEVAVVVDERTPLYQVLNDARLMPALLDQQRLELGRMGAPFDVIHLRDALWGNRDYKMYVFLDTFVLDANQRAQLDARLKCGGRTLVFVYAPGLVSLAADGTPSLSTASISSVVGMTIGIGSPAALQVQTVSGSGAPPASIAPFIDVQHYDTAPLPYGDVKDWMTNALPVTNPVFYVNDPNATSLGTIVGTNLVGLAWEPRTYSTRDFVTVFSAAPDLPAWLLRNLARQAGVHLYLDDGNYDVSLGVSKQLIEVATNGDLTTPPVTRTLSLPGSFTVTDVSSAAPLLSWPSPQTQLPISIAPGKSRLLYLSSPLPAPSQPEACPACPPGHVLCECCGFDGCLPESTCNRACLTCG